MGFAIARVGPAGVNRSNQGDPFRVALFVVADQEDASSGDRRTEIIPA